MSSNFGSSFAAPGTLYDIDRDGYLDIISVSVDGEVVINSFNNGEVLSDSNWPVYLSNDHFFAKPILYIYGGSNKKELILIISQKGRIYYFDWKGLIVKTQLLQNIYLKQNWAFIPYKDVSDIISLEVGQFDLYYELYPEVYTDAILLDLSVDGVLNDIVIPVNFVTKEADSNNVIVAGVVVFNLASESVVDIHPISITKKESEYPGYLLSNIDILHNKEYRLVASLSSGIVYQLQWNKNITKFQAVPKGHITYNQGPHNCQLTTFCSDLKEGFLESYLCCAYVDFFGHLGMLDLSRHKLLWEYAAVEAGIPTATKIFVDRHRSPYIVFSNNRGFVHCVSLLTAKAKEFFPLHIPDDSFSASAEVISGMDDQLFLVLISDKGYLYTIPIDHPLEYKSIFHNTQIASYVSPTFLPSSYHQQSLQMIVYSKSGFIFRLDIPNFKAKDENAVRTDINMIDSAVIGTIYGLGSKFSLNLKINDPRIEVLKEVQFYIIKVFINEYLYCTYKEASSGSTVTDITVVIDLSKVNTTLIAPSVFIFGTATILVTDSFGYTFPPDHLNIRLNYDFQFELIWKVYLTFFICVAAILLFHFNDYNDKLHIPIYINREN